MDPNAPKSKNNLPFGLTAANAIKTSRSLRNARKKKAMNAFKKWMNSRKLVKSLANQKHTNQLEKEFLEANSKGAPAAIAKFKAKKATPIEIIRAQIAERKARERVTIRNARIAEKSTGLPPLPRPNPLSERKLEVVRTHGIASKVPTKPNVPVYRPPVLLPSQREVLRTQGIAGLSRSGGTRKKRRT